MKVNKKGIFAAVAVLLLAAALFVGAGAAANTLPEPVEGVITLIEDEYIDIGDYYLPANCVLNGNNKKISGDSAIFINQNGGTVKNVVFENIHNDTILTDAQKAKYGFATDAVGDQTAIYAKSLSGTATITGCTFKNVDWDAIQVAENIAGDAEIVITNNVFETKESPTNHHTVRYVHVQSSQKNVAFSATVTGNKFYDCDELCETAIEVYYPADANKLLLSSNFIDAPIGCCVGIGTNYNDHVELVFPLVDVNLSNPYTPAATITDDGGDGNVYIYPEFADALDSGKFTETNKGHLKLWKNVTLAADLTIPANTELFVPAGVTLDTDTYKVDINGELIVEGKFTGTIGTLSGDTLILKQGGQADIEFEDITAVDDGIELEADAVLIISDDDATIAQVLGKVKSAKTGASIVDAKKTGATNAVKFTADFDGTGVPEKKDIYIDPTDVGGTTEVGISVPVEYTVTIPPSVTMLAAGSVSGIYRITVTQADVSGTENVILKLTNSANSFNVKDAAGHTVNYVASLTQGGDALTVGSPIVSCPVTGTAVEQNVYFRLNGILSFAGTYQDTLTFSASVE